MPALRRAAGLVDITSVSGVDIYITGRREGTYQNACNGDSGGPIFVEKVRQDRAREIAFTHRGSQDWPP